MPATSVHFNGSVNLPDAETVMREISRRIPTGVRRMTDGETGERGYWVFFQRQKFAAMPEFVDAPVPETGGEYERIPLVQLAAGVDPAAVSWPDLGYAAAYAESFELFARLQDEGVIPPDVRLQLQFPTPIASLSMVVPQDAQRLAPSYAPALFADLAQALARLPHDRIAVQWDVAVEIGLLSGGFPVPPPPFDDIASGLAQCQDQVPADVPAGVHLCYGDYEHQHFVQPKSLALQVRQANAVAAAAGRPLDFVAFTVPQGQEDEAYFTPLRELALPDTELAFALVPYHPDERAAGTSERQCALIDAALATSADGGRDWAVCTECGMGRVDRDEVPHLLDLHAALVSA